MNRRLLSVFVFALVVALLASLAVYRLVLASLTHAPEKSTGRTVAVATRDLDVGTLISDSDIRLVSCRDCLSTQLFTDRKEVIGRGVIATIFKDEPILSLRLAAKGAGAGLAS